MSLSLAEAGAGSNAQRLIPLTSVGAAGSYSPDRIQRFFLSRPEKELPTEDGYRWVVYSEKQTGLTLLGLEDLQTGVILYTPLANPERRSAAHKAWGGARQSRAPGTPPEIYVEMGERGVDPDQKIDEMFSSYGHKSVGDMARMQQDADGIPVHYCFARHNDESLNGSQEKSTRYQSQLNKSMLFDIRNFLNTERFSEGELREAMSRYAALGRRSVQLSEKYKDMLRDVFTEHFKPKGSRQRASLESRVLDCTRFFVLLGQRTGMADENSAREWSRVISDFKASPVRFYRRIAEHTQRLFTPTREEEEMLGIRAEAPSLIRHTEPTTTTNDNIRALREYLEGESDLLDVVKVACPYSDKAREQGVQLFDRKYTEGEKMAAQYILTIWPAMDSNQVLDWVHTRPNEIKREISRVICNGHHCNNEMSLLAATRGITLAYKCALGEARDFDRHRAWGRFMQLAMVFGEKWSAEYAAQILSKGFALPAYLTHMPELKEIREQFEQDMAGFYEDIYEFVRFMHVNHSAALEGDYSFVLNVLPMAHMTELWMHGDPKQALYKPDRRRRPGGHVNYILLAQAANELLRESDPYLSGMTFPAPNPFDREEFFDRG